MRAAVDAHEDVLVNILDRKAKIHELNKQITMGGKKRDRLTAQYHRKQSVPGMFELRDSALAVVQNALESVQVALELTQSTSMRGCPLLPDGAVHCHSCQSALAAAHRHSAPGSRYGLSSP